MKHLLALLAGLATGVVATLGILFFVAGPSAGTVTPLTVSDRRQFILNYSAVPAESIVYTNRGDTRIKPIPDKVPQLWEGPVRDTEVLVTEVLDYRGLPVGIGIKFSSRSEDTDLLNGEAIVDSAWHVSLPQKGTFVIAQRENRWDYLRSIVIPAYWSPADSWKGNWRGLMSAGPNALGTARVYGGSGLYRGRLLEAVEFLNARAWSTTAGPVAADGQLIIEYPDAEAQVAGAADD